MAREPTIETVDMSPVELLDLAVEGARRRGHEVSGWTLQSDESGYTAWLYFDGDDDWTPGVQVSLSREVEVQPTAEMAARDCYLRAVAMTHTDEAPEA